MKTCPIGSMLAGDGMPGSVSQEFVCWTRMQTEAGQSLESILSRKERERRLSGGSFFWGIGNAPPPLARSLAKLRTPVRVIFSVMKSRPKRQDVSPGALLVWRRYFDEDGCERPLPEGVLVTSRAETKGGLKTSHYALVCHSERPIMIDKDADRFDPSAYRNAGGTGAPVGSSQVTALLRRVKDESEQSDYRRDFTATLSAAYWARLSDPIVLSETSRALLASHHRLDDGAWLSLVDRLRTPTRSSLPLSDGSLLL